MHSLLEKKRQNRSLKGSRKEEKESDPPHTNATHSRLLTKKQLSDMTWGVRALSKELGSVRLKLKVETVFVLTKAYDITLTEKTKELVQWLLSQDRETAYTVYVEDTLERNERFDAPGILAKNPSSKDRLKYWTNDLAMKHAHRFDFVITLGGDGTLLYASWLFQRIVPPVLSFSLGSLGFLTKFDFAGYEETLAKAFSKGVTVSLRLRFEGTIMRSQHKGDDQRDLVEELLDSSEHGHHAHKAEAKFEILNDIVVDRGPSPSKSDSNMR